MMLSNNSMLSSMRFLLGSSNITWLYSIKLTTKITDWRGGKCIGGGRMAVWLCCPRFWLEDFWLGVD